MCNFWCAMWHVWTKWAPSSLGQRWRRFWSQKSRQDARTRGFDAAAVTCRTQGTLTLNFSLLHFQYPVYWTVVNLYSPEKMCFFSNTGWKKVSLTFLASLKGGGDIPAPPPFVLDWNYQLILHRETLEGIMSSCCFNTYCKLLSFCWGVDRALTRIQSYSFLTCWDCKVAKCFLCSYNGKLILEHRLLLKSYVKVEKNFHFLMLLFFYTTVASVLPIFSL